MEITKYNVPSIMLDNDMQVLNLIFKVIEKLDDKAVIEVHKSIKGFKIIVKTVLKVQILRELKELSYLLGDIFEFSKTLNLSKNISFFTKQAG